MNFLIFFIQNIGCGYSLGSHRQGGSSEMVQVGKDQQKEQSEKDSHSKNRDGKNQINNQVLIMKTYRKPNEQLFS